MNDHTNQTKIYQVQHFAGPYGGQVHRHHTLEGGGCEREMDDQHDKYKFNRFIIKLPLHWAQENMVAEEEEKVLCQTMSAESGSPHTRKKEH